MSSFRNEKIDIVLRDVDRIDKNFDVVFLGLVTWYRFHQDTSSILMFEVIHLKKMVISKTGNLSRSEEHTSELQSPS